MRKRANSSARLGGASALIGLCAWAGCGGPQPTVRSLHAKDQTTVKQVEPPAEPAGPVGVKRRLIVVATQTPPGAAAITQAMTQALQRRGFEVMDASDAARADLVVAIVSAARPAGSWGGIPSHQVMLRYSLLDARQRTPLGSGVDSAHYADPVAQRAVRGALNKAADNLARKLDSVIDRLPPAPPAPVTPPKPEPAPAPSISLACLPFRNATNRPGLEGWCESLASIAIQEFKRLKKYRIVERARLREVLKEEDIAGAIETSPGAVRRVAEKLGVELLLVGEVAFRPNGDLAITARIVSAKDAEVRQAIHAAGPVAQTNRLEQAFRRQLVRPAATWITRQLDHLRQVPVTWPDAGPGR